MNRALGSPCTWCWERPQHKAGTSQVLQGPCPPLHRTTPLRRYIKAEPQDIPVVVGAVQTGPHWRSTGSGMDEELGLREHIQQDNMFQWGVHCLVIIRCPPLTEGD